MNRQAMLDQVLDGHELADEQALQLADYQPAARLMAVAGELRDRRFDNVVTYSRKVFLPLTHLCRDVCHYCTFARTPRRVEAPYMSIEQVLDVARAGDRMGCREALLTLGEKPEARYGAARDALRELGCASTLEYVAKVAAAILEHTGLLPHINAGCMTEQEIAMLRPVSASMGIMLESASERLCQKGMPHYGSPDKQPARRLETIALAGRLQVPFTSGILIGIGETRRERIESLLALRALHRRFGHIQEIIVQNFRAKPGTLMASAPEPDLDELLWTLAVARIVFGPDMSLQAPPNLSPGVLPQLVGAGIIAAHPKATKVYGGRGAFLGAFVVEVLLSIAYAPVMMIQQTRAVVRALTGKSDAWAAQSRDARSYPLATLLRFHWMETALGLLLIAGLASGLVSTWLIPIAASLLLAVPLSALSAVPVSRLLPSKLRMNNPTSLREPAIARRARIERHRIDTLLRNEATATAK